MFIGKLVVKVLKVQDLGHIAGFRIKCKGTGAGHVIINIPGYGYVSSTKFYSCPYENYAVM